MLSRGEEVRAQYPSYDWYEVSAIVLAEKITPVNGEPYWQGPWKNVAHKFLPVMIRKEDKSYYGWIELSFDTAAEKMILHRVAICTEANREVKTGW